MDITGITFEPQKEGVEKDKKSKTINFRPEVNSNGTEMIVDELSSL